MFPLGFSVDTENAETMDGESIAWMREMAERLQIRIVGSLPVRENGKYYNRLIWMRPDGNFFQYDKHHLFSMGKENQEFSPGEKRVSIEDLGWKFRLQLCYELRFPLWSSNYFGENCSEAPDDALVYLASWPLKRIGHWKCLLQARAIENQCYVIGCNAGGTDQENHPLGGHSMVVTPDGQYESLTETCDSVLLFDLRKEKITDLRNRFPVHLDWD